MSKKKRQPRNRSLSETPGTLLSYSTDEIQESQNHSSASAAPIFRPSGNGSEPPEQRTVQSGILRTTGSGAAPLPGHRGCHVFWRKIPPAGEISSRLSGWDTVRISITLNAYDARLERNFRPKRNGFRTSGTLSRIGRKKSSGAMTDSVHTGNRRSGQLRFLPASAEALALIRRSASSYLDFYGKRRKHGADALRGTGGGGDRAKRRRDRRNSAGIRSGAPILLRGTGTLWNPERRMPPS